MIDWMKFDGKRVLVNIETIKGVRLYTGVVKEVVFMGKNTEGVDVYFLEITDKFGESVGFQSSQIKLIEIQEDR